MVQQEMKTMLAADGSMHLSQQLQLLRPEDERVRPLFS